MSDNNWTYVTAGGLCAPLTPTYTLEVPATGYIERPPPGHFGIRVGAPPNAFPPVTTVDFSGANVTITLNPVNHWSDC